MNRIISKSSYLLFLALFFVVFGCQNTQTNQNQSQAEKVYVTLEVQGMTCGGCESTVQGALVAIEGIDSAFASHENKEVRVLVDTTSVSLEQMQEAINSRGYLAGQYKNQ